MARKLFPLKKKKRKLSSAQQKKVSAVMREFEAGKLHHGGSGKIVKDRKVAQAIAHSEARKKRG